MENLVSVVITGANVTAYEGKVDDVVTAVTPYTIVLDGSHRDHMYHVVGAKSMGYVNAAFTGLGANLGVKPPNFDFTEFTKDKDALSVLDHLIAYVESTLLQRLRDTRIQLCHELLEQADISYSVLKLADKNGVTAVKTALDAIADTRVGMGKRPDVSIVTVPPNGEVTENKTIPGSKVVNLGNAVLCVDPGPELAGQIKQPEVKVTPGGSYILPEGYTQITVRNQSGDTDCIFAVKIGH